MCLWYVCVFYEYAFIAFFVIFWTVLCESLRLGIFIIYRYSIMKSEAYDKCTPRHIF